MMSAGAWTCAVIFVVNKTARWNVFVLTGAWAMACARRCAVPGLSSCLIVVVLS